MERIKQDGRKIAEEAAHWVAVLTAPDGAKRERAFHRWLSLSSKHRDEYWRALCAYRRLDGLRDLSAADAETWLAGAPKKAAANVVSFPLPRPTGPSAEKAVRRERRIVAAVASIVAAVLIGTGALFWIGPATAASEYATRVGEQRTLHLEDGSDISLNTRTRIHVTLTRDARTIELMEGEFVISVGRDPRPLSVISAGTVIQDIGTRFAVRRRHETTDILVTEGLVDVTYRPAPHEKARWSRWLSARLAPGDGVSIGPESLEHPPIVRTLSASEIERRLSWREGMLHFSGETLERIVEEINRYNIQQIQLTDPALKNIRLGVRLAPNDVNGMIGALRSIGYPVFARTHWTSDGMRLELALQETASVAEAVAP